MKSRARMTVLIQDRFNENKKWELSVLSGGLYLRQMICDCQYGRGCRVTKKFVKDIGILDMKCLSIKIRK